MKPVRTILLSLLSVAGVLQSSGEYVIVTANNVNVRTEPNTSSSVVGKAYKDHVYPVFDGEYGDFTSILYPYFNDVTFRIDTGEAFIASRFIADFVESPISRSVIGHTFRIANHDSECDGVLEMEFVNSSTVNINYRLYNPEMQRAGGTGTLEWGSMQARYDGSKLEGTGEFEGTGSSSEIVYDAARKMLYCCGWTWEW